MKIAACQPPDVQNDAERALSLIEGQTTNAHRHYGPTAVIDSGGTVVAQVPLLTTGMVVVDFSPSVRC